ncbi:MAG: hypothetical protein ACOYKA_02640 [Legionellaceae bacterium]
MMSESRRDRGTSDRGTLTFGSFESVALDDVGPLLSGTIPSMPPPLLPDEMPLTRRLVSDVHALSDIMRDTRENPKQNMREAAEELGVSGMLDSPGLTYLGRLQAIGKEIKNRMLKESFLETLNKDEEVKELRDTLKNTKLSLPVPGTEGTYALYSLTELPDYYHKQIVLVRQNPTNKDIVESLRHEKKEVEVWIKLMNDPRSTDAKIVDGCVKLLRGLGVGVMVGGVGGAAYALTLVKWGLVGGGLAAAGVGMAMTWPIWVGAIGVTLAAIAGYVLYKTYKRHEAVVDKWFKDHLKDPTLRVAHAAWEKTKAVFGPMVNAVGNFVGAYVDATVHFTKMVKFGLGHYEPDDLHSRAHMALVLDDKNALLDCYATALFGTRIYDAVVPGEPEITNAQLEILKTIGGSEYQDRTSLIKAINDFRRKNIADMSPMTAEERVAAKIKAVGHLEDIKYDLEEKIFKYGNRMNNTVYEGFKQALVDLTIDIVRINGEIKDEQKQLSRESRKQLMEYVVKDMLLDVRMGIMHTAAGIKHSRLGVGVGNMMHGVGEGLSHAGSALKGAAQRAGHSFGEGFSHLKEKIAEGRKRKETPPVPGVTEEGREGYRTKLGSFFSKAEPPVTPKNTDTAPDLSEDGEHPKL